jgi:UDP-N-acetylglucosamine--N-acetylmuramyl-(pentapeptide) pyrophosphoryl-undecaprenol N-acetylglucosamine transferase
MRILFACGGTAGHINPAIAIANEIKANQPDAKILFVGNPNGMEATLIPNVGFDFVTIKVLGFRRSFSINNLKHNAKAITYLLSSAFVAKKIIKNFSPDIVVGTGGYVSGPIVKTAANMKIKTLIHEQNAFPGVTTRLLAKNADAVCLASKASEKYFENKKNLHFTGNPVRESIIRTNKSEARKALGIKNQLVILSFGGSLGAKIINQDAFDIIEWCKHKKDVLLIHSTGKLGYN